MGFLPTILNPEKDREGAKYIIEMQVNYSKEFQSKYQDLKEVIFPKKSHYKSDHIILHKATHEHDHKDLYFTFIELPKFKKIKKNSS
ncbi:MAG: hypothetical protein ACH349_04630 [Candidatus Rhabdochlamydia sp.]|nr:hypothetical protein [Chlamydiota bacterium]